MKILNNSLISKPWKGISFTPLSPELPLASLALGFSS